MEIQIKSCEIPMPSPLVRSRKHGEGWRGILVWCLLAGLAGSGRAWGAQPATTSGPSSPVKEETTSAERLIYLPYKNLRDVFEREGATVFLPYLQLLKWGERPPVAVPPVSAVLSSARYTAVVEKEVATVTGELTVQVLGKNWSELPVEFGTAGIGKLSSADNKVLLRGTGEGTYALLFPAPGEYKVKLELLANVRTTLEGRILDLVLPPSGITTFDITVPGVDQSIEFTPPLVSRPATSTAETTRLTANLGATRKFSARWFPKLSTAPVMEFLASVSNTIEVRIADGLVHTQSVLNYQVQRGELDQIRLVVPTKHRILDVSVPGMKAWKATAAGNKQLLTIDLLGRTARNVVVEVHTERAVGDELFEIAGVEDNGTVHGIHAEGAVRESGFVVLTHAADLTLAVEQQSGLVRVEAGEVPTGVRRGDAVYYKFYTPKFRLQAGVKPVEPRVLVDQQTRLVFTEDELQLTAQIQNTIERAGVFELRYKIPPSLKIDRVECDQMQEFKTPEGQNLLIVALREKTRGQIQVTISGHQPRDAARKEAQSLPTLEPLSAARETGRVFVFAPESLEIITTEKGVQAAQPYRPAGNEGIAPPQTRLASAWNYSRRPLEIPVRTERRPTRLTASVATTALFKQDLVEVHSLLNFNIEYAGLTSFRFAVPEAVAASLQLEPGNPAQTPLKEWSKAPQAEQGWVPVTVVLQRELTGPLALHVKYDLKPEQKGNRLTANISPLRVFPAPGRAADAPAVTPSSIYGELLVQHDRALSVSAHPVELEAIDVRELTRLPQNGALAYRYYKQPEKLDQPLQVVLTAAKHEIQPVVETVMVKGLVEAVITRDKSVTYRCRYKVKTSARQRLAIDLPKGVQPLDTLVAGERVDLEKREVATADSAWEAFSVNVARKSSAEDLFELALVFRMPYQEEPLRGVGGPLALVLPRIGGASEGVSPVAVQHLVTKIWVPHEYALVGAPHDFILEGEPAFSLLRGASVRESFDVERWFGGQAGGMFAFTTAGHAYVYSRLGTTELLEVGYWRTSLMTWIISGTLVVIGLVLLPTSGENKLALLLLMAFLAAMFALQDVAQVVYALSAARFGWVAMVGLWIIHAVARPRACAVPAGTGSPLSPPPSSPTPPMPPATVVPPEPSTG